MLSSVEEDGFASVVSWQPHGRCFIVHKPKQFVDEVMPRYFKQSKLTSFQRQVNLYGFRRLTAGRDRGAYYHELFLRGRPDLHKALVRIRIKGTGFKSASSPATEPDFYKMKPCPDDTFENHAAKITMVDDSDESTHMLDSIALESPKTVVTPPLKPLSAPSQLSAEDIKSLEIPDDLSDPWTFKMRPGHMSLQSIARSLVDSTAPKQLEPCPVTPESPGQKLISYEVLDADLALLSPIEDSPSPSPVPFHRPSFGYAQSESKRDTLEDEIYALVNADNMVVDDSNDPLLLLDEVVAGVY
jgi:hypothetical protein